jgi:hypothetical protein
MNSYSRNYCIVDTKVLLQIYSQSLCSVNIDVKVKSVELHDLYLNFIHVSFMSRFSGDQ